VISGVKVSSLTAIFVSIIFNERRPGNVPYFSAPVFERFLVGPHLEFGGVKLEEIVDTVGTPVYIIDAAVIRARCKAWREAAPDAHLAYASKANSTLAVLDIIRQESFDVDAASMGEMEAALRAGFKGNQVTLHGNAKSDAELDSAVKLGVRRVVIDAFVEIDRLALFAEAIEKKTKVLIRVAPAVNPKTHMAISTGQEETKFGFSLSTGAAAEAVAAVKKSKWLTFCGLHFHVGSQLMNSLDHVAAVKRIAQFAQEVGKVDELVVGGGLGIRYTPEDNPQDVNHFVDSIRHAAEVGFAGKPPKLGFEPGRAIVGEAGTTIYRVAVRKTAGRTTFLSVDGGLADNARPQLYDAAYMAYNASKPGEAHIKEFRIAGRHCETDTLIASAMLPMSTEPGDLIAIPSTGAYCASLASNYNRYPRPATVVVEKRKAFIAVHREAIDHMFVNERLH
jgi:diaminopimelate decarboxylase